MDCVVTQGLPVEFSADQLKLFQSLPQDARDSLMSQFKFGLAGQRGSSGSTSRGG